MRVLLDHNVPPELRHEFSGEFSVETAVYKGWDHLKDRELLERGETEFDVLITLDTNPLEQQNTERLDLGIVIVDVHPIHPDHLRGYITSIAFAVHAAVEKKANVRVTSDSIKLVET